jgi:hypothetical protein
VFKFELAAISEIFNAQKTSSKVRGHEAPSYTKEELMEVVDLSKFPKKYRFHWNYRPRRTASRQTARHISGASCPNNSRHFSNRIVGIANNQSAHKRQH